MSANGDPVVRLDRQTGFFTLSIGLCRMKWQDDQLRSNWKEWTGIVWGTAWVYDWRGWREPCNTLVNTSCTLTKILNTPTQTKRAASEWGETGSKIVAVTSLAAASDEASW